MYKESIKSTANARKVGIGIPKQFYEEARKTKSFDYTAYLSVDCMLEINNQVKYMKPAEIIKYWKSKGFSEKNIKSHIERLNNGKLPRKM